jgi:endoglucanase
VASINAIVSLFWPSNSEPDLAGYNIYRSEDESLPPEQWLKLTPRLHTPTTFRDDKVQVGKKYYYQLTAVDTSGNESARSVTISETVNP